LNHKYELGTIVQAKYELIIPATEEETGVEYEIVIMEGTRGEIVSCGRSSSDGFKLRYDVEFDTDELAEVSFFESDIEDVLTILEDGRE